MTHSLFDIVNNTLRDELFSQLSPTTRPLVAGFLENMNSLYTHAYWAGLDSREIAIVRQIGALQKRFIGKSGSTVSSTNRNNACWKKFISANSACKEQNILFKQGMLDVGTYHTLELAREDIHNAFWKHAQSEKFEFTWTESPHFEADSLLFPISGFSTGPGTCYGTSGKSLLEKYPGKFFTSSEKGSAYLQVLRRNWPTLNGFRSFSTEVLAYIKPSFAPKDSATSRLIAPQANGDLLLQYPAESCLRNMLSYFCIDLETQQDLNRTLARKGSLYDNLDVYEWSLRKRGFRPCTIDLTNASDINGTELCKFLLPPPLFNYLEVCRCELMKNGDDLTILEMMATMGNAYCFPLQTLIFTAIVRAVYKQCDQPLHRDSERFYSVYGDDIIVDVSVYDSVTSVLSRLKMQPNLKKSFSWGLFRESCGEDYFSGYNVRPVFCEDLRDDCNVYSLANRLIDWGIRHSVNLSLTVGALLRNVRIRTVVPLSEGEHCGLRVPLSALQWLPREWSQLVSHSITVDLSHTSEDRILNPYLKAPKGLINGTTYVAHKYLALEQAVVPRVIRVNKRSKTLFPFLRGGFTQRDDERFAVVSQITKLSREQRLTSHWDVPPHEKCGVAFRNAWRTMFTRETALMQILEMGHCFTAT